MESQPEGGHFNLVAPHNHDAERGRSVAAPPRDADPDARTVHQPVRSVASRKTSKCAFCRKDHKKCVRTSDTAKCERCTGLAYPCFGAISSAISSSPKRVLNRRKCDYCRDAKQKCLPTDRIWPAVCDRCCDRGLPCSEPGIIRKRRATSLESSVPPSANHTEIAANPIILRHPQVMQFVPANQATPPETPQAWPLEAHEHDPRPLPAGVENILQPSQVSVGDVENLAVLSRAADRVDGITPFQYPRSTDLCHVCVLLQLSPERFIVEDYQNRRKRPILHKSSYQEVDTWSQPSLLENASSISPEKFKLGNIASIAERSQQCPFCRLVRNAAQDQVQPRDLSEINMIIAYASWQLDGRDIISGLSGKTFSMKPRTRRIRLHWSKPREIETTLNDAFVVLMADHNLFRDKHYLGRPINTGRDITGLTKDWLRQCQHHHFHFNEVTPQEDFAKEIAGHRFMLLDVIKMRTVFPKLAEPQYVALSYAAQEHFPPDKYKPKQSEDNEWVDKEKLPRTIQDVIKLVQDLSFQYLWFHPLCTIYDEDRCLEGRKYPRDRNHHIMDQIFGNSFLAICAADEPNAGLVALHTPRKPVVQHIEKCGPDLQLMVSHPAETYLEKSAWFTRAWTFQERILAQRCLVFSAGRVWFQCRDASVSEDIIEDLREPCWSIDMLYTQSQTLSNFQDRLHAIRAYMKCVEAYTMRKLACQDDILVAFEGLSKMIGAALNTDLLHGLPSSILDLALLWEFQGTNSKDPTNEPGKERKTTAIRKFPSWSWSGWEGSVTYRASTLLGVQSNISAWLSKHTWISWYVRDRYNIPRRLFRSEEETILATTHQKPSKWMAETDPFKETWKRQPNFRDIVQQSHLQQPLKWPALNRSAFFKSVPNLHPDVMDIDSDLPEDLKVRDTEYLQFWTWSAFFRLTRQPLSSSSNLGGGLSRFGIIDCKDDFCGTIILPDRWFHDRLAADSIFEFIAISEAKDFSPEEFDGWTYYIPKEQDQREWDLWYVLLVEKVDESVIKRAGLGKVFQEAFEYSYSPGNEWREFIMA